MPSEILLPAGTEFIETANIPVLIAEALNPKPANEPRLGRQTESDSAEVKSAAFQRYIVEREHLLEQAGIVFVPAQAGLRAVN